MVDQVEVFFHSQQPYVHVREEDISQFDSPKWLRAGSSPT